MLAPLAVAFAEKIQVIALESNKQIGINKQK